MSIHNRRQSWPQMAQQGTRVEKQREREREGDRGRERDRERGRKVERGDWQSSRANASKPYTKKKKCARSWLHCEKIAV